MFKTLQQQKFNFNNKPEGWNPNFVPTHISIKTELG